MRVMVANRGEVACRVLATLRRLGIASAAVHTRAEAHAPHVFAADRATCLAGERGYLDGPALLAAAHAMGATAVHPGYGYLSQSPDFAAAVEAAGLVWIGPSPAAMAAVGDKRAARALAAELGVPVVPGAAAVDDAGAAAAAAAAVGYPVLLKAAAGGGGKGMRPVHRAETMAAAFAAAAREAQSAFADGRLLLERLIQPARHVEIQALGDGHRAVALGSRDCSLQRRYQKIVEEAPAVAAPPAAVDGMAAAAVRILTAARFAGAATVEFLLDAAGQFTFLEVNPRLQVEHPTTELCLGIDLVAEQVALAHGGALCQPPPSRGHAIEVRLCAEDPGRGFLPAVGEILALALPHLPNLRIDHGLAVGQAVTPLYDSLLMKLIAWGPSREAARQTLRQALADLVVLGVQTNQAYLAWLLDTPWFVAGEADTTRLEATPWQPPALPAYVTELAARARRGGGMAATGGVVTPGGRAATAGEVASRGGEPYSPWELLRGFRLA